MGDYNPRQITQMRWKDVKNLEKFKFITGNYDFTNEVLEHASEDKQYRPFIDAMIESNNKNQTTKPLGIIVNDSPDAQVLYVGTVSAYSINMRSILSNYIYNVDMSYNYDTDILTIEWSEEEIMSTDNVKTLFGNQSIIGTGNIDLYRHDITIMGNLSITVYSSSNLKIDSVQDLTTVLKPYVGLVLGGVWYDKLNGNSEIAGYGALIYKSDNLWYMLLNTTESNIPVDSVTDIVTTI